MKLEIKHIAPYLPYELLMRTEHGTLKRLSIGSSMKGEGIEDRTMDICLNDGYKPILFDLSCLTQEIEINGERFVPLEKLEAESPFSNNFLDVDIDKILKDTPSVPTWVFFRLVDWKFDVFGLIPAGLAEDVTKLEINPYK